MLISFFSVPLASSEKPYTPLKVSPINDYLRESLGRRFKINSEKKTIQKIQPVKNYEKYFFKNYKLPATKIEDIRTKEYSIRSINSKNQFSKKDTKLFEMEYDLFIKDKKDGKNYTVKINLIEFGKGNYSLGMQLPNGTKVPIILPSNKNTKDYIELSSIIRFLKSKKKIPGIKKSIHKTLKKFFIKGLIQQSRSPKKDGYTILEFKKEFTTPNKDNFNEVKRYKDFGDVQIETNDNFYGKIKGFSFSGIKIKTKKNIFKMEGIYNNKKNKRTIYSLRIGDYSIALLNREVESDISKYAVINHVTAVRSKFFIDGTKGKRFLNAIEDNIKSKYGRSQKIEENINEYITFLKNSKTYQDEKLKKINTKEKNHLLKKVFSTKNLKKIKNNKSFFNNRSPYKIKEYIESRNTGVIKPRVSPSRHPFPFVTADDNLITGYLNPYIKIPTEKNVKSKPISSGNQCLNKIFKKHIPSFYYCRKSNLDLSKISFENIVPLKTVSDNEVEIIDQELSILKKSCKQIESDKICKDPKSPLCKSKVGMMAMNSKLFSIILPKDCREDVPVVERMAFSHYDPNDYNCNDDNYYMREFYNLFKYCNDYINLKSDPTARPSVQNKIKDIFKYQSPSKENPKKLEWKDNALLTELKKACKKTTENKESCTNQPDAPHINQYRNPSTYKDYPVTINTKLCHMKMNEIFNTAIQSVQKSNRGQKVDGPFTDMSNLGGFKDIVNRCRHLNLSKQAKENIKNLVPNSLSTCKIYSAQHEEVQLYQTPATWCKDVKGPFSRCLMKVGCPDVPGYQGSLSLKKYGTWPIYCEASKDECKVSKNPSDHAAQIAQCMINTNLTTVSESTIDTEIIQDKYPGVKAFSK